MFQDFVTVFNLAYCCHNSHFLAETDCRNLFQDSPPWSQQCGKILCILCEFKIWLTIFNQSYKCQTSHYPGRDRLPKALLMLPSLAGPNLNSKVKHCTQWPESIIFVQKCMKSLMRRPFKLTPVFRLKVLLQ